MERFRFWVFLFLAVGFGAGLKLANDADPNVERLGMTRLEKLLEEGRPVCLPGAGHDPSLFAKSTKKTVVHGEEKVAGLEPAKEAPKASPSPTPKPPDKKKDDKKKKKKKKKIKGIGDEAQAPTTEVINDDTKKDDGSGSPGGPLGSGGGGYIGAGVITTQQNDGQPHTAAEWKAFLLPSPDFERTSKFIRYYQTGLVSGEIFYDVTHEMAVDPRPEMRELGVMALGSTPSLRSFTMLVNVEKAETPKSRVRAQAYICLKMYSRLEYVKYLAQAMRVPNDPTTNLRALSMFKLAIEQQKDKAAKVASTPVPPSRVPATLQAARYLSSFRSLLQQIMVQSPDTNVRQSANEARTNLEDFLQS